MLPWIIGGLIVAAGAALASSDSSSKDSSSSSSSRRESYTQTEENVIYEPEIETEVDYLSALRQEWEDMIFEKYGAYVKFYEYGDYEIITYGDEYEELEKKEVEYQSKLYELENLEAELKYL